MQRGLGIEIFRPPQVRREGPPWRTRSRTPSDRGRRTAERHALSIDIFPHLRSRSSASNRDQIGEPRGSTSTTRIAATCAAARAGAFAATTLRFTATTCEGFGSARRRRTTCTCICWKKKRRVGLVEGQVAPYPREADAWNVPNVARKRGRTHAAAL